MKILHLLLLIFSLILLNSCTDTENKIREEKETQKIEKENKKENKKKIEKLDWSKYIYFHTSKDIISKSTVEISFVHNFDKDATSKNLISFSPNIEGEIKIDKYKVIFTPKNSFKEGEIYEATLDLTKLIKDIPKKYKTFKFKFHIIKQKVELNVSEFQNNFKKNSHTIGSILKFRVAVKKNDIKPSLTITQGDRKLNFVVIKRSDKKFEVIAEGIKKEEKESEVIIKFNGEKFNTENIEKKVKIPALAKFEVTGIKAVNGETRYINISFSDSLDSNQNLNGLILVKKDREFQKITYKIDNNNIKIYFNKPIMGKVKVYIKSGIKSINNRKIEKSKDQEVIFEILKPSVKFIGKGVILPEGKKLIVPFEAVNFKSVRVLALRVYPQNIGQFLQKNSFDEDRSIKFVGRFLWEKRIDLTNNLELLGGKNRYGVDVTELVKKYPNALFRLTISGSREDSTYICKGDYPPFPKRKIIKNLEDYNSEESSYWDDYDSDNESYSYSNRKNPCYDRYYDTVKSSRNIIASDIGIIAKEGNNSIMNIVTTSIKTSKPISARITVFNFQGEKIASTRTDFNGFAKVTLKGKKAFYLVAEKSGKRGYLKLNVDSILSVNNFDTSGITLNSEIKGHIYGERDIWRPGDDIYLTFVLKDGGKIPKNHPISLELYTPRRKLYKKYKPTKSLNKFYAFKLKTSENDITGNWKVVVKIGKIEFRKNIKIETIVPNRLKIKITTNSKILSDKEEEFKLSSVWLHGAKASNLLAQVNVSFKAIKTKFKIFTDYTFDDNTRFTNSRKHQIFDGSLNENGDVTFKHMFSNDMNPSGMLKATFETKVFEDGGDFSVDTFTLPYSKYENYIGIKMPKGGAKRGILLTDKKQTIKIASLDKNGQRVSLKDLEVKIYKISWRWWWSKTKESLAKYSQNSYMSSIIDGKVSTKDGEGSFDFEIKYPAWGRYLVRVCDKTNHCSSKIFYADWPGWAGRARKDNGNGATRLNFSSDKEKYVVGEKATLFLPVTENGRALISIENGSKVLSKRWAMLKKGKNKITIPITKEMTPNIFFNVTLLQAHQDKKNDLPIRLYGIIPVSVDDPRTNLTPILKTPEVVKPLDELEIKVSEKNSKEMTYTIAVVDEGLLSLTRFKTPNLKKSFFKREGLGVKTWDLFDYVIGAYGINLEKIISIGGDSEGEREDSETKGKNRRFVPVVKYIGPFHLKAGAIATHKIKIPKYVGAVRVMVVAGNQKEAYGSADKEVKVKSELMVLTSLPRTLKPDDELLLPITLFKMNPEIKDVEITLTTDKKIQILENGLKPIKVKDGWKMKQSVKLDSDEKIAFFKIKVKSIGKSHIKVSAKSKKFNTAYDTYIEIKPPNNMAIELKKITIEANKNFETKVLPFGIQNSNKLTLEFSTIPPLNLEKRLNYLIKYPHGCIEQTTSSVFPQLYLNKLIKLNDNQKSKIQDNIEAAILRIQKFQNSEGGFTYWPGAGDKASLWGTNYALNFLLEAEKLGYSIPGDLKYKAIEFQNREATTWIDSKNRMIQSYRLYTLAIARKANIGAMNRLKELKNLDNSSKWLLASSYYIIGQKKIARDMAKDLTLSVNRVTPNTYGSTLRDKAIILNSMNIIKDSRRTEMIKVIAENIASKNWYSTQTTAYSLMAISRFYSNKTDTNFNFKLSVDGKETQILSNTPIYQKRIENFLKKGSSISVKNPNNYPLFLSIINMGIPKIGTEKEYSNDIQLFATYEDVNNITKIKQGKDFNLLLKIKNLKNKKLENIAITYIVPSGVQINRNQIDQTNLDFIDIRDDRVYYYLSLNPNETKKLHLSLNGSYSGKYYHPAISASSMYDNTISALLKGFWIEIILKD